MVKKLEDYVRITQQLLDRDMPRDLAFQAYSDMYHLAWDLPKAVTELQWVRKTVTLEPHDAIVAGERVLSALKPGIKFQPLLENEATQSRAGEVEKILEWALKSANKLRGTPVVAEVTKSALLYMGVALLVIDLEHHRKVLNQDGANTKGIDRALKGARYSVKVYNPRDIHTVTGPFGTEAVLLCQQREASDVAAEWGLQKDRRFKELLDEKKSVDYYDYWDDTDRVVWCVKVGAKGDEIEIFRDAHEMDFLPWVAVMGRSDLETNVAHQHHPILYGLYASGLWETENVVRTLRVSEAIAYAANPRYAEEGSSEETATLDRRDPARIAKVPMGDTLRPLPPPIPDQGMLALDAELRNDLSNSTVSRVLTSGATANVESFAALNLTTQTAVGALKPAKELAQNALAQMFTIMLLWIKHTGKDLVAYSQARETRGKNLVIAPDDIDEAAIYIEVELKPDVPTDRLQRANAALMLSQLGYPSTYALEDVGVEDPAQAQIIKAKEDLFKHRIQLRMDHEKGMHDLSMQNMQFQMQMQQQQMAQQMQQGPPPGPQGGAVPETEIQQQGLAQQLAQMGEAPGFEASQGEPGMTGMVPGGQGFNPAMGGTPPAQAFPEAAGAYWEGQSQMPEV